jgi:putative PIN family toxin of toxin-antitoxin system
MIKAVLDANVFVSGILNQKGIPAQILRFWQDRKFDLLISQDTVAELKRVLRYPHIARLHRWHETEIVEFLSLLRGDAIEVNPLERITAVSSDDSDNRYLECAAAGEADHLVTGDKKHLLPLKSYQNIRIITPATFLTLLKLQETG